MLRYLRIRDLAVLADVEIRFGPGLNLLTGETGAGKSIIVDALGLVLGDRASSDLVRTGAERAVVEAAFALSPGEPGLAALQAAGIEVGPEAELVVRREVSQEGSRGFLNGSPATVSMLRQVGDELVEIHGQHEHLSLLRPRQQLELLDSFAGAAQLRESLEAAHARLKERMKRLNEVTRDRAALEERLEVLRYRLREIDQVGPENAEEEGLHQERDRLAHAVRIGELASEAEALLEGDDGNAVLPDLARLESILTELATYVPDLAGTCDALREARVALEEVAVELHSCAGDVPQDPSRLEAIEARLSALASLSRRFGGGLAEVIAVRDRAREELEELEEAAGDPSSWNREVEQAAAEFAELAARLSARRRRAAAGLRRALRAELADLAMEATTVKIDLGRGEDPDSPVQLDGRGVRFDARGIDQVEILLSANPGEAPRPLARAASGGELSRLMLALECARLNGKRASAGRLVFDEVDAGVGGRVAAAVGERLHRISRTRQVLCVTHLPQIACRADRHLVVRKTVSAGRTSTEVKTLDERGRVGEVARMLAGAKITAATRRHALEMIGGEAAAGEGD